jgi:Transposase DNA-binding
MDITEPEKVEKWAVSTFGAAELGDPRRTDRLIKVASALASNPSASLPCALETWGETLGAYRLLDNPAVSYEQIISPRLLPDLSRSDPMPSQAAVGRHNRDGFLNAQGSQGTRTDSPIGNSREDLGFSLHTVLAMNPQTQHLLGCQ